MDELVISGVTLDLDLMDADVVDVFESEVQKVVADSEKLTKEKNLSNAERMRELCRILDHFFDRLFGTGVSEELFGTGNNLRPRLTAFQQIVDYQKKQSEQMSEMFKVDTYSPRRATNQEQRKTSSIERREPAHSENTQRTYNTNPQYLDSDELREFMRWKDEHPEFRR